MDIRYLIAQINGGLPDGFVRPAILDADLPECRMKRCRKKVAVKHDGTPAHACSGCLARRAASCRRRRRALVAQCRSPLHLPIRTRAGSTREWGRRAKVDHDGCRERFPHV